MAIIFSILLVIGFIFVSRVLSRLERKVEKLKDMGFSDNEIDDILNSGVDINTIGYSDE